MRVNVVSKTLITITHNGFTFAVNAVEGTKTRLCCTASDPDPLEAPGDYDTLPLSPDEAEAVAAALAA